MNFLTVLASTEPTEAAQDDILSALGIHWELLIVQIIAFLVLVWLLGKFVYPLLMKSVDERQKNIEDAANAAKQAQAAAAESEAETADLLAQARKEAAEIVSTAKLEAAEIAATSEEKARTTAERIVADAQAQVAKDIDKARREIHDETLDLIALATEKIARVKLDKKADHALITEALEEAK